MSRATIDRPETFSPQVCQRAVEARDSRFDGVFFVAITTTRVYCRPICPSRRADPQHRRFFPSAAAAEQAGFRPCLRCRPELAPGLACVDSLSRLASQAAHRIAAGALNGRSVASLAAELRVSERHLRRALHREMGMSPIELAQTHRLLLAKRLLADTRLSVTRIAFASGFQSLRRFNVAFRDRYRMSPTDLRRVSTPDGVPRTSSAGAPAVSVEAGAEPVSLTLAYRPPFAWDRLMVFLAREAIPGIEVVEQRRYWRTVRDDGQSGFVCAEDVPEHSRVLVEISPSLLPSLMPLLVRLRRLFDLDAQPAVVDAHLASSGLDALVSRRPGVRIPGAFDSFETAMRTVLRGASRLPDSGRDLVNRVVQGLGEPIDTGFSALNLLTPSAQDVADAGSDALVALGVSKASADVIVMLARLVTNHELDLEPGGDVSETFRALLAIGIEERLATTIVMRAMYWPDAFPSSDHTLQCVTKADSPVALRSRAEQWRPWRAYAAMHLWLQAYDR